MRGTIKIYLDGPRETDVELPDDWHQLTEDTQNEVIADRLNQLIDDALAVQVDTDEEN